MYRKILVPLDGSALAECALPHVRALAKGGQAGEVVLLKVIEVDVFPIPKSYARSFDFGALKNAYLAEAQKYLDDLRAQLSSEGIKVKVEMLEGKAGETIADYARKNGVDLIVIATHGYAGMKQLMFGSVALKVLHDSAVPILLVRPEGGEK
jgi:nucleotide-binding universal stress UspA family protein